MNIKASDSDLWELIVNDDPKAFSAFYERYWYSIYTIAFSHLKDGVASEEIVHNIFFNIWNRRKTLSVDNFKHYFSVSAKNQVYKKLRAQKRHPVKLVADFDTENGTHSQNAGYEKVRYLELENELNSHLQSLPLRCREIFKLSRFDHLSNNEIAEQLGISKRTVENQITAASKYLRVVFKHLAVFVLFYFIHNR